MLRLSLGLTCLVLGLVFAASALGIITDRQQIVLEARKKWTETVSLECALAVQRRDESFIKVFLPHLLQREPALASVGLRSEAGELVFAAGDHATDSPIETSTGDIMRVPIVMRDHTWGHMEFCFVPNRGLFGLIPGSFGLLILFFGLATFLGFSGYLRIVLRRSDKQTKAAERVRAMLDTVTEGVLILDRDQQIVLANRSFAAKVGVDSDKLTGRRVQELPWLTHDLTVLPWTKSLNCGSTETGVVLGLLTQNEGALKLAVNSTRVLGEDGECKGTLSTFDDLTSIENRNLQLRHAIQRLKISDKKIRHQSRDLRSAKTSADAANKAKGEFLANVSHEIRTPMNTILGMTDVALALDMPAEQRECFGMVKVAGQSLLELINELLDLSKIEAGKFQLECIPFSLHKTVTDTVRLLAAKAHAQELEFLCDIAPEVPDRLIGDPARLRQVLINLLGNAIKFTGQGQVALYVAPAEATSSEKVGLRFSVEDTGIGIPKDKQEAIFQPFVQADGSTTRQYGGTGLGLTICSQIVGMMGGRIWAESRESTGSRFQFVVLFDRDSCEMPKPDLEGVARGKILVVDGNADARSILQRILQSWGFTVHTAAHGTQALLALERGEDGRDPFAMVLLAGRLPDMDGLDLARIVKNCCSSAPRLVMMPTTQDRKDTADLGREIGVDAILTKPVMADNLSKGLREAATGVEIEEETRQPGRFSSPEFEPVFPPLRILFVDDNAFNQRVGQLKLTPKGHSVQLASDGMETLEILARENFDLLLLDMQMPGMSGLEVAREIRRVEAETGNHLPIIAVTAHCSKEMRQTCIDAGMDDYVSKPINDTELWRAMKSALLTTKWANRQVFANTGSLDNVPSPLEPTTGSDQGVLHLKALLARVGGNRKTLLDLLGIYNRDSPGLITQIKEGVGQDEAGKVQLAAHSLKGMLAFLEVGEGVELARQLEFMGRDGALQQAHDVFEALACLNQKVLDAVAAVSAPYMKDTLAEGAV